MLLRRSHRLCRNFFALVWVRFGLCVGGVGFFFTDDLRVRAIPCVCCACAVRALFGVDAMHSRFRSLAHARMRVRIMRPRAYAPVRTYIII